MNTKTKMKPLTALERMEALKKALEGEVLRLCNAFELATGLVVVDVRHPRCGGGRSMLSSTLKEDERVDVGTVSPFPYFRDYR